MAYTFARIGAVLQFRVADYYVQDRHGWLRFHERRQGERGSVSSQPRTILVQYLGATTILLTIPALRVTHCFSQIPLACR